LAGPGERAQFGCALNDLVKRGEISAPVVIGRDHLGQPARSASPFRETEAMKDGSDAIADWAILNALLNTASGAAWVAFHHGGGVGIGNSLHAGTSEACGWIGGRRGGGSSAWLTNDPASAWRATPMRGTPMGPSRRPPPRHSPPDARGRRLSYAPCGSAAGRHLPRAGAGARGRELAEVEVLQDAAVLPRRKRIAAVGPYKDLRRATGDVQRGGELVEVAGVLFPGFRRLPYARRVRAPRLDDHERRRLARTTRPWRPGGGIPQSVRDVRARSESDLTALMQTRVRALLAHGSTTIEVKSGYGLDAANELKQLRAIRQTAAAERAALVPPFLGAHVSPARVS